MTAATRILQALDAAPGRSVVVPRVAGSARAFLAAELVAKRRTVVLVARDQEDAETLFSDLAFMLGTDEERAPERGLLFFGADGKSPYEEYSPDARAVMERIATLYRLSRQKKEIRAVVVTPLALARRHVPPSLFDRAGEYIVRGEEIDRDRFLKSLADAGYNPVSTVEDPGTFSVRGGIIDVFSPYLSKPLRIDLFGDEVESIRLFDPASQRTEESLDDAVILPAREHVYTDEIATVVADEVEAMGEETLVPTRKLRAVLDDLDNHIHFFGIESFLPLFHEGGLVAATEYLPWGKDVVYLVHEKDAVAAAGEELWIEARAGFEHARAAHQLALPPERHLTDAGEVLDAILAEARAIFLPEIQLAGDKAVDVRFESTEGIRAEILKATRAIEEGGDVLLPVVERLRDWRQQGMTNLIVCNTRGQAERLRELLSAKKVQVRLRSEPFSYDELASLPVVEDRYGRVATNPAANTLRDRSVHCWLVLGEISGGFVHFEGRLAVIAEEEIFGQRIKRKRKRTPAAGAFVSDLQDLKPGDYVVHLDYGIGLYHGMTKLAVNGVESDFLNIEYKGNDKLYLPVHRLKLIQKYAGASEGKAPALDRLGAQTWANTKRKVKDTLLKMAAELLRLYAVRQSLEGFALRAPDETFIEFEAEFPFEPTPDQAKAIDDVVRDLQKPSPMDRLISGDVGYGKTEVAMRASMLAVLSGKQVAVLVPTTVLAAQHFNVFGERFANHGVRIGIVSRFQSAAEIKATLDKAKQGQIDIVIGTHRLLSKDVTFKDLGLLVIDEEHRFGVADKERLKKYRAHVHVLAMSATPIPRTLHMGMMGVRDLSTIATPPVDRLAVKTEVHKFSEEIIREAILREIRRGGQVFVVHNRVASMPAYQRLLERLVPEARVAVGHGQMDEDQLEKVMVDFMNKTYNVLLSTTIIESGIDISNANTIIINRADTMGLAQLYQLKGRVGRSKTRGFAYFLIPAGNLTPKAKKRIAVLQRFTELGAGFKVASQDLEIRGAGNLLGKQQSGTISQVGFDTYQMLLAEAVAELKGSGRKSLKDPEVQVPVPALIPDNYVPAPGERLAYYQRFNSAESDDVTFDLLQEITDMYGTPPAEVENLAQLMLVKQRLSRIGALGLDFGAVTKQMPARVVVRFDHEEPGISPQQLVGYVQARPGSRKLTPEGKLILHLRPFEDPREILQQSKDQLDELILFKTKQGR
ncbi:transcription-repair coupling factor [Myxococcota bacterium]|nr:transcription-repair coupling factor [Myxococcota bacterium]